MKLEEYRQHYIAEKVKVEGNLLLIEAEAKRVRETVLRFEGAIACTEELQKEEADALKKKLESHESLSEEDIQRALGDNQAELNAILVPEPSEDHVVKQEPFEDKEN